MQNTFEVVFENVPEPNVGGLVDELLSHAKNIDLIEISEEDALESGGVVDRERLSKVLLDKQDLTAMIRVRQFAISSAVLDVALIRVVKYENTTDVDISFNIDEANDPASIMQSLQPFALEVAGSFSTGDVYGGLEPANDYATRYFTNLQSGPLPRSDK